MNKDADQRRRSASHPAARSGDSDLSRATEGWREPYKQRADPGNSRVSSLLVWGSPSGGTAARPLQTALIEDHGSTCVTSAQGAAADEPSVAVGKLLGEQRIEPASGPRHVSDPASRAHRRPGVGRTVSYGSCSRGVRKCPAPRGQLGLTLAGSRSPWRKKLRRLLTAQVP